MKRLNKIGLLFLLVVCCAGSSRAQLNFHAWSQNYKTVTSYLGAETDEKFNTFQFDVSGLTYNKPNWSLTMRLVSPIEIASGGPNRSGKIFPADKISLRWTTDDNNPNFNLTAIGVTRNKIPLQAGNEVTLINRSNVPISGYGQHNIRFLLYSSFNVEGGMYLSDFLSPSQWGYIEYRIPVVFTLYDEQKAVLGTKYITYTIQFPPRLTDEGAVDIEPDYSVFVTAEAANATLSFVTREDYQQGVSLSFDNAVKINARTDFQLSVKATESNFTNTTGRTLPLSLLSLQLTPGQNAKPVVSNPLLLLSNDAQTALSGTSTDKKTAQFFNLNYKAKLTPSQIVSSDLGTYSVSLLYLLMPR
jgi:hypothetical protein